MMATRQREIEVEVDSELVETPLASPISCELLCRDDFIFRREDECRGNGIGVDIEGVN